MQLCRRLGKLSFYPIGDQAVNKTACVFILLRHIIIRHRLRVALIQMVICVKCGRFWGERRATPLPAKYSDWDEILVGKRAGRLRRQRKHWSDHDSSAMGVPGIWRSRCNYAIAWCCIQWNRGRFLALSACFCYIFLSCSWEQRYIIAKCTCYPAFS